jgi:predicted flap endonuclease-1-like 5' DNA nuclease
MSTLNRWLQQNSKSSFEQQCQQLTNLLRTKEQALETASHELKVKTAAIQLLEQKIMSSETQCTSAQRELAARSEQLTAIEAELAIRSRRLADLETGENAVQQQVSELQSIIATQGDELRAGQQAQEVLKEEIRVLREHIVQLNEGLSDRDYLRAQMAKFESAQDRVHLLEIELSDREAAHRRRIQQLEQILAERNQRIDEFDASVTVRADELRGAQQARQTAEQVREVQKEEIRVLREQITQLNEDLPARERLRAQVKELESMRSRVHQLEVELSDREAAHRGTIQQLERALAERDQRIDKLVPVTHLLREKEATIKEWERTHARTVRDLEAETTKLHEQGVAQDQLRTQHQLDEQQLQERDAQIADLTRKLDDLQAERHKLHKEVQGIPEKDEQIDRLQKRLKELRGILREKAGVPAKAAPAKEGPRQARQNGATLSSQGGQPKISKDKQEDDLKKIHGIGPAVAQTLHKMGTRTFIQIARWKPEDIEKIAKKLDADPKRIKLDNWVADAKKQHYQKYGERV